MYWEETLGNRRTNFGSSEHVIEEKVHAHIYAIVRQNGLAGVVIVDDEYPAKVAISLLQRLLSEFQDKFGEAGLAKVTRIDIFLIF